jgi:MinD superfamily P-loop ATPase
MKIAVASGKGGTGKTLVAVNLALALSEEKAVQILDCDVEEPNVHLFINPKNIHREPVLIPVPEVDEDYCDYCGKCTEVCEYHAIAVFSSHILVFPKLCHGCGACSYLCPQKAITEEGREIGVVEIGQAGKIDFVQGRLTIGEALAPPVIREVKKRAWNEGTVIIDVSPGTSCPVVEAVRGSDFCLLVTEPTPFGLNDLELAVGMVKKLGVPSGVVINRVSSGDGQITDYCRNERIPIFLRIPLDSSIARLYSKGIPLIKGMPEWREKFIGLFYRIMEFSYERGSGIKR